MHPQNVHHMFDFTYQKTTFQILDKANRKIAAIEAKIAERRTRIAKTMNEYGITDAAMNDILVQLHANRQRKVEVLQYTTNVASSESPEGPKEVTIGAGVVNLILTEQEYISAEKSQLAKLQMISRNLGPVTTVTPGGLIEVDKHQLSYDELTFLDF